MSHLLDLSLHRKNARHTQLPEPELLRHTNVGQGRTVENQSPSCVGVTKARIASAMETAVDAADERPHFLISAPPAKPNTITPKHEIAHKRTRTHINRCAGVAWSCCFAL